MGTPTDRMQLFYSVVRTCVFAAFGGRWPNVAFLILALGSLFPLIELPYAHTGNTPNSSSIHHVHHNFISATHPRAVQPPDP
jgi:hypothetical protein